MKVNAYLQPHPLRNKGEMIRAIINEMSKPDSNFAKYPEDYVIYEIGEFDDDTGLIKSYDAPEIIGKVVEFRRVVDE
jgi:hypothetical protein